MNANQFDILLHRSLDC